MHPSGEAQPTDPAPRRAWRLLEHPADLAIEGRGATPEAALEAVVQGLLAQLGPAPAPGATPVTLELEGLDRAECVVGALNELLYRVNAGGEQLGSPQVGELGQTRVRLRVLAAPRPAGIPLETEVKAATYHDLALVPDAAGGWRLTVVFDV